MTSSPQPPFKPGCRRDPRGGAGVLPDGDHAGDDRDDPTAAPGVPSNLELALEAFPDVPHSELTVPGHDGAEIVLSVFEPADGVKNGSGVYWIHGGGMITGDRFLGAQQVAWWVSELDTVIVSVEYPGSPPSTRTRPRPRTATRARLVRGERPRHSASTPPGSSSRARAPAATSPPGRPARPRPQGTGARRAAPPVPDARGPATTPSPGASTARSACGAASRTTPAGARSSESAAAPRISRSTRRRRGRPTSPGCPPTFHRRRRRGAVPRRGHRLCDEAARRRRSGRTARLAGHLARLRGLRAGPPALRGDPGAAPVLAPEGPRLVVPPASTVQFLGLRRRSHPRNCTIGGAQPPSPKLAAMSSEGAKPTESADEAKRSSARRSSGRSRAPRTGRTSLAR